MEKELKEFTFLHLKSQSFSSRDGGRLFNDIIEVTYSDHSKEYRIYLNNKSQYVSLKYNNNKPMINEISKCTWTLDNIIKKNSNFVKSEADKKILSEVIERYGLNKKQDLKVKNVENDCIDYNTYEYEKKKFEKTYKREI